jgi:hypothetical protein
MTDPQQRLLLEAGAQLLAGAPDAVTGGGDGWLASAGVYVGEWRLWLRPAPNAICEYPRASFTLSSI